MQKHHCISEGSLSQDGQKCNSCHVLRSTLTKKKQYLQHLREKTVSNINGELTMFIHL